MAQETQTGALYQPRGVGWGGRREQGSKGRTYMYTYGWFMLRLDRKQNSVKQLFFNKKLIKKIEIQKRYSQNIANIKAVSQVYSIQQSYSSDMEYKDFSGQIKPEGIRNH